MVEQLSDVNDQADTNYDSSLDVTRRPEVALTSLVEELRREVSRLEQEMSRMRQELERLKSHQRHESQHNAHPLREGPTGQWTQIYFLAPFTVKKALELLKECVDEAVQKKLLKGESLCEVDIVVDDTEDPTRGWQALRLTCAGTRSVQFRSCVLAHIRSKQLEESLVSTRKPSSQSPLYRRPAHGPPLCTGVALVDLKDKVESTPDQ